VRETWSGSFIVQTINGDQSLELIFAPAARLPMTIEVTHDDARLSGRVTLGVLSGDLSGTIDQNGRWSATGSLGGNSPWPGADYKTELSFTPGAQGVLTINVTGSWGTGMVSGPVQLVR